MAAKQKGIPKFEIKPAELVYKSLKIKKIMGQADSVAKDPGCLVVTILGEPGVMKTELARWIAKTDRRKSKIIEIPCGAIPETLLEAELYGRQKWAHNDAKDTRIGLVEEADGGTCIFDDINFIPTSHQCKLAYFIENRAFRRVGSSNLTPVDTKIIATTNVTWKTAVIEGHIIKDLHTRLNSFRIHIPPLRDRREDIDVLSSHFLTQKSKQMGKPVISLDPEVKKLFTKYHWPYNVRELKQTVESSVTRSAGNRIFLEDLPEGFGEDPVVKTQTNHGSRAFESVLASLAKLISANESQSSNNTKIMSSGLDDKEKEILTYMINTDNPVIYRKEYQNVAELSKSDANRLINKLEERGFLRRRGVGRGTFYTISLQELLAAAKNNELSCEI
jgi:DNA-binding NtrC family response regulator